MKDCIILGSGRSGTSMTAGILHQAGYHMGADLYPGVPSNPKGFFESPEINHLNEDILRPYDGVTTVYHEGPVGWLYRNLGQARRRNPGKGQRWLCSLDPQHEVECQDPDILRRIERLIEHSPFCYKDPRFCYTLPVWRPFLRPETVLLCVFREPSVTARSILKECADRRYLRHLPMSPRIAYAVYVNLYSHLLERNADPLDRLVFLHYEQIYRGDALSQLSDILEASLSHEFVDRSLRRSRSDGTAPAEALAIYDRLCELAGYREQESAREAHGG